MLLERCEPGAKLRELDEVEQDLMIARLLRRLWRTPPQAHHFRPWSALMHYWSDETQMSRVVYNRLISPAEP